MKASPKLKTDIRRWDGLILEYTKRKVNQCLKDFEKLDLDFDDLMQEAWFTFNRCSVVYHYVSDIYFFHFYKANLKEDFDELLKTKRYNEVTFVDDYDLDSVPDFYLKSMV